MQCLRKDHNFFFAITHKICSSWCNNRRPQQ